MAFGGSRRAIATSTEWFLIPIEFFYCEEDEESTLVLYAINNLRLLKSRLDQSVGLGFSVIHDQFNLYKVLKVVKSFLS